VKFKQVLAWIKANVWIVVCSAIVLVALPVSMFFSQSWLSSTIKKQEKLANDKSKEVQSAEVTYTVPQFDPSMTAVSQKGAPNAALINHFRAAREEFKAKVDMLAKEGEEFNKGVGPAAASVGRAPFQPLVADLFPKPKLSAEQAKDPAVAKEAERLKLLEFEDAIVGKRGRPNPYQQLLDSVRAGSPPSQQLVMDVLQDTSKRETDKITAGTRKLTDDEEAQIKQTLQNRRLAEYQARARALGVYMTINALPHEADTSGGREGRSGLAPGMMEPDATIVTGAIEPKRLTTPLMFMHQWNLWVLQDFFAAVRLTNTGSDGKPLPIDRAVVKRIDRIELRNPERMKTLIQAPPQPGQEDPFADPNASTGETAPTGGTPGLVPLDKQVSHTGRSRGGWNPFYEVRRMRVTCVVSSARLNDFIGAIGRTNFLTVTDTDLFEVDVWNELREGYYYGEEHVVRAVIDVESIWLKSWLVPLMPNDVKRALGMEVPPEETAPPDGESSSNPG
jgi:hypothetical protein